VAYLLDANIFIQAKNLTYGFDFCPAFWDWLIEGNDRQTVFSIEKVGDELCAGSDDLAAWAKARGPRFFVKADQSVLPSLGQVSSWVTGRPYEAAARNLFLQSADYYLVAQAHAGRHTVVTHEIASNSSRRIKIPDVCIGLQIKCVQTFAMLRQERARFVLEQTKRAARSNP
jgi:hypothetical protein